jgi:hypothetical protein
VALVGIGAQRQKEDGHLAGSAKNEDVEFDLVGYKTHTRTLRGKETRKPGMLETPCLNVRQDMKYREMMRPSQKEVIRVERNT